MNSLQMYVHAWPTLIKLCVTQVIFSLLPWGHYCQLHHKPMKEGRNKGMSIDDCIVTLQLLYLNTSMLICAKFWRTSSQVPSWNSSYVDQTVKYQSTRLKGGVHLWSDKLWYGALCKFY